MKKHLEMLGLRVEDKVTGFKGVCSSVSFDLYGCICGAITPGISEEGKTDQGIWFDISRLKVIDKKRVMEPPNYEFGRQAEGLQGSAEKPAPR